MSTKRQDAANRRNGQDSTGPRTDKGLAASSKNALKHGLRATRYVVLSWEDQADFDRLLANLGSDYPHVRTLGRCLIDQLAADVWRAPRPWLLENQLLGQRAKQLRLEEALTRPNKLPTDALIALAAQLRVEGNSDSEEAVVPEPVIEQLANESAPAVLARPGEFGRALAGALADLDLVSRYETALQRRILRTIRALEREEAKWRRRNTE